MLLNYHLHKDELNEIYKILGFCRSVIVVFDVLIIETVGSLLPTFRDMSVPTSRVKVCPLALRKFSEDGRPQHKHITFINSAEQCPWEANRFSASRKVTLFYGTWNFIAAFTSSRHLSLSWARSIQSIPPHTASWRSILILSSHLRLGFPSCLFPSGFPTKTLYAPLLFLRVLRALPIALFLIW